LRWTGKVSEARSNRLAQVLEELPDADQKAVLDWLEVQLAIQRAAAAKRQKQAAPPVAVPFVAQEARY
jgi:hypothetical protein